MLLKAKKNCTIAKGSDCVYSFSKDIAQDVTNEDHINILLQTGLIQRIN